jgi:hypothetical protein
MGPATSVTRATRRDRRKTERGEPNVVFNDLGYARPDRKTQIFGRVRSTDRSDLKAPLTEASMRAHSDRAPLVLAVLASVGWAQAPAGKSTAQIADAPQDLARHVPVDSAPTPAPDLQRLITALAGRWAIQLTFEPRADMPKGSIARGVEV